MSAPHLQPQAAKYDEATNENHLVIKSSSAHEVLFPGVMADLVNTVLLLARPGLMPSMSSNDREPDGSALSKLLHSSCDPNEAEPDAKPLMRLWHMRLWQDDSCPGVGVCVPRSLM